MSDHKENKKSKFELTDQMIVIVNKDWSRTYVASIQITRTALGNKKYSGKCDLKNLSIVCSALNKTRLSMQMDELATIIEDRFSGELPAETPVVAGTNCCLN